MGESKELESREIAYIIRLAIKNRENTENYVQNKENKKNWRTGRIQGTREQKDSTELERESRQRRLACFDPPGMQSATAAEHC